MSPTVLSAFTGAGGLDLGLEFAGFRTIASIEREESARKTIFVNRPHWNLLPEKDIAEVAKALTPRSIGLERGELGVLAGGPPCQPFSKASQWKVGMRRGLQDSRAKCLYAFLRLLELLLPRVLLIENVPGFVVGTTSAVSAIERALQRINRSNKTAYRLQFSVVDAADYGVPQHRRRAILIATRSGDPVVWPRMRARRTAMDALTRVRPASIPTVSGYWSALLPSIPPGENYLYHTPGAGGEPLFGRRRRFWSFLLKLSPNRPAWTISAKPGPATGPFHWDNRPLAIEEMLALQTFTRDWRIEGPHTARVRQVGNATPALLAEVFGRAIGSGAFDLEYKAPPVLSIPKTRKQPTVARIVEVPEEFLRHRALHEAHPGEGLGPGAIRSRSQRASGA